MNGFQTETKRTVSDKLDTRNILESDQLTHTKILDITSDNEFQSSRCAGRDG